MFAFFGLGLQELLILGVLAAVGIVVPVIVILVARRSSDSSGRVAELEDENRRLRAELDRAKEDGR